MAGSRLTRQLGDTHLDEKESVVRQREELLHDISGRKAYGQEDVEKAERSTGSRMYYSVLLRKLKILCPDLLVRDGIPGNVAVYRLKTQDELVRDGYDLQLPQWYNEHRYATGFPKEDIPEWGHYVNDADGIAVREVRGWRSVLIALIRQGIVTYEAAVKEFGDPIHDQRSKYWFEQLHAYINKENDIAQRNKNILD